MRSRLMAYSKAFPHAKLLREKFQHVSSLAEIEEIAFHHIAEERDSFEPQKTASASTESRPANFVSLN
jgi:hypothetical protein